MTSHVGNEDEYVTAASGSMRPVSFDGYTTIFFFFLFVLTAKIINLIGAFIAIFLPFLLLRIHNCSFLLQSSC